MMLNACRRTWAAILVTSTIAHAPGGALLGQSRIDWGNVATLKAGRAIVVYLLLDNRRVEGEYVANDETSLTVRLGGVLRNIERDDIFRVISRRESPRRKHVAIGALAGAGVGFASIAGQEDWSGLGRIMWAAIGAGAGALVGFIASKGADSELIYEARPTSPVP